MSRLTSTLAGILVGLIVYFLLPDPNKWMAIPIALLASWIIRTS